MSRYQNGDCHCNPGVLHAVCSRGREMPRRASVTAQGQPPLALLASCLRNEHVDTFIGKKWNLESRAPFLLSWKVPHFQEFSSLIKMQIPFYLAWKAAAFTPGRESLIYCFSNEDRSSGREASGSVKTRFIQVSEGDASSLHGRPSSRILGWIPGSSSSLLSLALVSSVLQMSPCGSERSSEHDHPSRVPPASRV